jgi:hypothetical protein
MFWFEITCDQLSFQYELLFPYDGDDDGGGVYDDECVYVYVGEFLVA